MIIEGGCGDWRRGRRRRRRRGSKRQGMPNGAKGLMWKGLKGVGWTGCEGGGAVEIAGVHIGPTRQKKLAAATWPPAAATTKLVSPWRLSAKRGSGGKAKRGSRT